MRFFCFVWRSAFVFVYFLLFLFYLFCCTGIVLGTLRFQQHVNKNFCLLLLLLLLLLLFTLGHGFEFFISGRKFGIYSLQFSTKFDSGPPSASRTSGSEGCFRWGKGCRKASPTATAIKCEVTKSGRFPFLFLSAGSKVYYPYIDSAVYETDIATKVPVLGELGG
jgi:hypothetical protein